jgi:hypothetical protein
VNLSFENYFEKRYGQDNRINPPAFLRKQEGGKTFNQTVNPVKKEIENEAPAASCEARAGEGDINGRSSSY